MGNSRGLCRAFSCQAFSRPAQFRGGQYPGEWGLEVPGEGSRGATGGRGSWRQPPRAGKASSGLPVPAEDQRDPEAVCPSSGWQLSPLAKEARQQL